MGHRHNRKQARHRPIRRRLQAQQQQQQQLHSSMPGQLSRHGDGDSDGFLAYGQQYSRFAPQSSVLSCLDCGTACFNQYRSRCLRPIAAQHSQMASGYPSMTHRHFSNDIAIRERRIFGGDDEDGDGGNGAFDSETDIQLKGKMLDVVLGLFNGIDYED